MDEADEVGRLLEAYSSKPPKVDLTQDEKRELARINKRRDFRRLKDAVRLSAFQQFAPAMNMEPGDDGFTISFAKQQGMKDGMLRAIELLETLTESEENEDG